MTNLEALQALVGLEVTNLCEKTLLDQGIDKDESYDQSQKDSIELASAYVYKAILAHPNFWEGKLKIEIDREHLRDLMNAIFDKNNIQIEKIDTRPEIRFTSIL